VTSWRAVPVLSSIVWVNAGVGGGKEEEKKEVKWKIKK
jgi:hypothetical protein